MLEYVHNMIYYLNSKFFTISKNFKIILLKKKKNISMTVKEHLVFYGKLKENMSRKELSRDINE